MESVVSSCRRVILGACILETKSELESNLKDCPFYSVQVYKCSAQSQKLLHHIHFHYDIIIDICTTICIVH